MDGNFLSRWSRLKRGEEAAAPERPPAVPAESDAGALTEEEIAALPDITTLTADSDITCFMRQGVPRALRNAALRRMWMLDSSIRDFVGPARDYAYDWNSPGGVPGSGALEPENVAALLRGIFGETAADPGAAPAQGSAEDHVATAAPPEPAGPSGAQERT